MPRTRIHAAVFLALLAFGVTLVQSPPVPLSEEKFPTPVDCLPYTRWDPSEERCVGCTEQCPQGEELEEDCGYNKEGYHVADVCRHCPNGTYSENVGQERCRGCKTCLSGYEQECDPKQPAVCLCAADEELAPGGTTCQKICCFCQSDPPSNWDVINDCVYRYPATPQYRCKKNSWSAGETCMQPPQPTAAVSSPSVSTAAPSPTGNTSVTTNITDAPSLGPTQKGTSDQPPPAHPTGESTTAKGMSTVTPNPVPAAKGKQPILVVVLSVLAGCAVIILIFCCIKRWKRQKAETEGGESRELLRDVDEGGGGGEREDTGTTDDEEERGVLIDAVEDPNKEVDSSGGGDSGNVSKESSDAGSDKQLESPFSSEDSLLVPGSSSVSSADGQGDDTQETGGTKENGETVDSDDETTLKEPGPEDTMEISGRIEGFPNDEKGRNAVPFGAGANIPNQQQPPGGQPPQPPPYPGPPRQNAPAPGPQQIVNITGGNFYGTVIFQDNSQINPAPTAGGQQQNPNNERGNGNPAPRQADGRRQHPAQQDMGGQRRGDGAGPNNAAGQGNQRAATVTQNDRLAHPPGNGNDRVGNRRRQDIQVNILPNPARLGQDVRFSCALPADIDANTCEFRWTRQGQVDCVAQVQTWNRTVQRCDAGVYTCEVTTAGGDVLDGQAELVITEDNAGVGVDLPGPSRRPRDNDDDQPTRKRPRTAGPGTSDAQGSSNPTAGPGTSDAQGSSNPTAGPGTSGAQGFANPTAGPGTSAAQGFSNPTAGPGTSGAQGSSNSSGQIQVPDFIQRKPLEAILNEEDLFYDLRIKLEQSDGHFRNIGSHFGLTHDELNHIEFTELRGKDSPLKAILEKVTKTNGNITLGEFLQYCDEKLKRRDVVKLVVDYFVEKEQRNQEPNMEVKEGGVEKTNVVEDDLQQQEECSKRDSRDCEMKEVGPKIVAVVMDDMPEESLSESVVVQKKLGTCDYNPETIELVEMQS